MLLLSNPCRVRRFYENAMQPERLKSSVPISKAIRLSSRTYTNSSMNLESTGTTGSAASVWDREESCYDAARQADPVYRSCIYLVVQEIPKGTALCLDAGCGTGLSTLALSARCGTIVAVDYSLESLQILKSKGLRNVMAVQADLRALPFKESVFGGCVCANTLQHFTPDGSQDRAIAELERVTRQNA